MIYAVEYVIGGSASVTLLSLIYSQLVSGAIFPLVKFRTTEPRAFWAVVKWVAFKGDLVGGVF